jgi:hypothetical protein
MGIWGRVKGMLGPLYSEYKKGGEGEEFGWRKKVAELECVNAELRMAIDKEKRYIDEQEIGLRLKNETIRALTNEVAGLRAKVEMLEEGGGSKRVVRPKKNRKSKSGK